MKAHIFRSHGIARVKAVIAPALFRDIGNQIGAPRGNADAIRQIDFFIQQAVGYACAENAAHAAADI